MPSYAKVPSLLIRSIFLPSGHVVKNNARVIFNQTLDLNNLLKTNSHFYQSLHDSKSFVKTESKHKKSSKSNRKNNLKSSKVEKSVAVSSNLYKLKAIILHYGSHDSGHFITIRKATGTIDGVYKEMWFRISDSHVDHIPDDKVDEAFEQASQNAYMFFYEK